MCPSPVVEAVVDSISPSFWFRVAQVVGGGYEDAPEIVEPYLDASHSRMSVGNLRRELIEDRLFAAARDFSIPVERRPNSTGSSFHVVIRHPSITLTQSKVRSETDIPPMADFRNGYAEESAQLDLFESAPILPAWAHLYALIIHGVDEDNPALPGFIRLAFPDRNMQRYCDSIDLIAYLTKIERPVFELDSSTESKPRVKVRKEEQAL